MNARLFKHLPDPDQAVPPARTSFRLAFLGVALAITLPGLSLASVESDLSFHRAVSAYGDGDLVGARRGFERVLHEEPNDPSALHYLALIAIQRRDTDTAVKHLEQLVNAHPKHVTARVDLATQYLKSGRDEEALGQLDAALELEPDHALANLYHGISLYRVQALDDALASLERAAELDPELSAEANYYTGLANAYLGDANAAEAAFDEAASRSPRSRLGRSAAELQAQVARSARPWALAATLGLEYNNNLRLSSDKDLSSPLIPQADPPQSRSGAGVIGLQGRVEAYTWEDFSWVLGYDGDLQLYWDDERIVLTTGDSFRATDLSQQTHTGWTNLTYDAPFASFAVRYDFSYTAIDLDDSFRTIHRLAPTGYVPISDWGLFVGFYQFLYYDYDVNLTNSAFDRTGPQHGVGARQFVFLPDPINYVVVGALWTHFDADGSEFRHDEIAVSTGGEVDLPWGFSVGALYSYAHRDYAETSVVTQFPTRPTKRDDDEHTISFNLDLDFLSRYELSLAGSYSHNSSNIRNFDIDRFIIGTYLRYSF